MVIVIGVLSGEMLTEEVDWKDWLFKIYIFLDKHKYQTLKRKCKKTFLMLLPAMVDIYFIGFQCKYLYRGCGCCFECNRNVNMYLCIL